jgi:hypothetical protein
VTGCDVTGRADRWIRWTTTGCVALLALIAGTVSYLHMHTLVAMHGQPGWVAVLTPLSVDGMIVAASTTLLAESRSGSRGGVLPWSLLSVGSVASLAANVTVAQPTITGRFIAAWPSFALICSYELLMRHVRRSATSAQASRRPADQQSGATFRADASRTQVGAVSARQRGGRRRAGLDLQREAWQWALANRAADGSLPSGKAIATHHGRHERWGRLVKRLGSAGEFTIVGDALEGVTPVEVNIANEPTPE